MPWTGKYHPAPKPPITRKQRGKKPPKTYTHPRKFPGPKPKPVGSKSPQEWWKKKHK